MEKGETMATCKDCLHNEACVDMLQAMGFVVDGDGYLADKRCRIFKDKNRYAEVIWCKDCIYRIFDDVCQEYYCNSAFGMSGEIKDNDFCSKGEREDNERKTD